MEHFALHEKKILPRDAVPIFLWKKSSVDVDTEKDQGAHDFFGYPFLTKYLQIFAGMSPSMEASQPT